MNKERGSVLLGVLVSIGICLFALNSVFFYLPEPHGFFVPVVVASYVIQILFGFTIIALALTITQKAYQLFIGFLLSGWGILSSLIIFNLPYGDEYWWPLYLITAGIFVIVSGLLKYKRVKFGYMIPGISLFLMGIWFSLFSFKIVKISFKTVVILLGPAFILLISISLIFIFMIQQRHRMLIIEDDDSGDFDDEDLSFPKID